jgi:hypothetical protein
MSTPEVSSSNLNTQRADNDADGFEPVTLVIGDHIFIACSEPANARQLYQHADPYEDDAGRGEILCDGCTEKKDAKIYLRFVCAGCGQVTWYQQVDGGTIQ